MQKKSYIFFSNTYSKNINAFMEMTFTKVKIMATFESKGEKDNGQDIQKVSLHFHCSVLKLRDRYIIIHYMILHNFCMFKIFHNKKINSGCHVWNMRG